MKTVTLEEFKKFNPCWLYTEKGQARLEQYGKQREHWTALDVLALEEVLPEKRLWAVLREEFIAAPILHEFACLCAERVLRWAKNPDPRSVAGIQAKRDWLQGKITREELRKAWGVADATAREVAETAAWAAANAAQEAARAAAWGAACEACEAAEAAAWGAACEACEAAKEASWEATRAAAKAARAAEERQWQVDMLIGLLEKADGK